MTCRNLGGVIICGPQGNPTRRHIWHCPTCNQRRRFARLFGGVWYGDMLICLACGEEFDSSEGRVPRPFRPRWREDNKRRARKWWDSAVSPSEFQRYVRERLRESFGDVA